MKQSILIKMIFLAVVMALTASCGGGGGGGGAAPAPTPDPTRAIVKLSTSGPAGTQIGGVDVTIGLPAGVTAKATVAAPQTDPGVVVASGVAAANSLVASTYTAGSPGTVRVVLVNSSANGFGIGEFATITCDLASGTKPAAADFTVQSATVGDLTGNTISGVTVTVNVTLE